MQLLAAESLELMLMRVDETDIPPGFSFRPVLHPVEQVFEEMDNIWADSETNVRFRANVNELFKLARGRNLTVQGAAIKGQTLNHVVSHPWLPFETERKIAKDFAFLAAWEKTPGRVSAATICRAVDGNSTMLSIAANCGTCEAAEEVLQLVLTCLRRCARQRTSESQTQCAQNCLEPIIRLHRNRILGRLASSEYRRPKEAPPSNPKQPLSPQGLYTAIELLSQGGPEVPPKKSLLIRQLSCLARSFENFNRDSDNRDNTALQTIIKAACYVYDTGESFSVSHRLDEWGVSPMIINGRLARHIRALGNYWRVCQYLAEVARSHPVVFENVNLVLVRSGTNKHPVHAEIQLLLHHELNTRFLSPRTIPASKKPCFLCYTFMRAHGKYDLNKSHGEIYQKWYLPGALAVDQQRQGRLKQAFLRTACEVQQILDSFKRSPCSFPRAMSAQSIISSVLDELSSPTASALPSDSDDELLVHGTVSSVACDDVEERKRSKRGTDSVLERQVSESSSTMKEAANRPIHNPTIGLLNAESIKEDFSENDTPYSNEKLCASYFINPPKTWRNGRKSTTYEPYIADDLDPEHASTGHYKLSQDSTTYVKIEKLWLHFELESIRLWPTSDALVLSESSFMPYQTLSVRNADPNENFQAVANLADLGYDGNVLLKLRGVNEFCIDVSLGQHHNLRIGLKPGAL